MKSLVLTRLAFVLVLLVAFGQRSYADGVKVGFTITVDGEGFVLNPLVTKIRVTSVEKSSLADGAGIIAGDEIIQIEGQPVAGKRARELQKFMAFNAGETRTVRVKHANGEQFDARLTKPKA